LVIDTSIFIEFLRAKVKTKTTLYDIPDNEPLFISSVTLYELLMGATTPEKHHDIDILLSGMEILTFDEDVAKRSAKIYSHLRKTNQMIEFRDIFIGATCIVNNQSLKTLNRKHFQRIDDLRLA